MTDNSIDNSFDEDVIVIGVARQQPKQSEEQQSVPVLDNLVKSEESVAKSSALAEPTELEDEGGFGASGEATKDELLDLDMPNPTGRKIVLILACVGVIAILLYVLDYWGIVQLPFF